METWQVGPTINAHQMNNSRAAKVPLPEPKIGTQTIRTQKPK